ncbi:MAG: DNA-directed RNA polymerase subunit beta [Microbacteriaceae bacterium]|nr:DNA-directed RNA polymerase subunit beta [Microbacteriaceae bacterium]
MSRDFHKPTRFEGHRFEAYIGSEDPAKLYAIAHETARTLVDRGHEAGAGELVERMIAYTDEHGIDALAELWAAAAPESLPGALWRLYLLRALVRQDPAGAANAFQRGSEALETADRAIAGAPSPVGPAELADLADRILRGAFTGDLADALHRAAASCRILAAGTLGEADASDLVAPDRATAFTTRAARLSTIAAELAAAARLEEAGRLD